MDSVWNQPCQVPKWVRGPKEEVSINWGRGHEKPLKALSLGNTVGTGPNGVEGEVIEVFGLDTLELLGSILKNKIVFFNRPMDPRRLSTGHAYGEAVDQRVHGAARASKYGAQAVLVRSVTTLHDDLPHTGVQSYVDGIKPIPSLAISTNDANHLGDILQSERVKAKIKNSPETVSYTHLRSPRDGLLSRMPSSA